MITAFLVLGLLVDFSLATFVMIEGGPNVCLPHIGISIHPGYSSDVRGCAVYRRPTGESHSHHGALALALFHPFEILCEARAVRSGIKFAIRSLGFFGLF